MHRRMQAGQFYSFWCYMTKDSKQIAAYNMMKSILKGSQRQQGSKSTLNKEPLRVTFSLDELGTQKDSVATQVSWMQAQQAEGAERRAREDFWGGESEFRRENISWNGFVLVLNPKFRQDCLLCGKCEKPFQRVADFTYHCLAQCAEIAHRASSHFVFGEEDWQRFQNLHSKSATLPLSPASASGSSFQTRLKEVKAFTKTTLSFWRETGLEEVFTVDQHYIYEHGLVMLLNPMLEDYSELRFWSGKRHCRCYDAKFSPNERNLYLAYHFNGGCCGVNAPESTFLLLDAELFYAYLNERGRTAEQGEAVDLPYLLYLFDHTALKPQIEAKFPKLAVFRVYIELFFGMPTALPQSEGLQLQEKRERLPNREHARTTFCVFFRKRKSFNLATCGHHLRTRTFHCPCQAFATAMGLEQFSAHLRTDCRHEPVRLAQLSA